jgi:TetR/AcrR family transcriptional repressor of nem operon
LSSTRGYQELLADKMLVPLEEGREGLRDLHEFFDLAARQLRRTSTPAGCLMVNSMTEFGGADSGVVNQAESYVERFQAGIAATLDRAAARGEIAKKGTEAKASMLVALLLGMNVVARSGVRGIEVSSLLKSAHALLGDWQSANAPKHR